MDEQRYSQLGMVPVKEPQGALLRGIVERVNWLLRKKQAESDAAAASAGSIANTTGGTIPAGALIGWTSAGALCLADASDRTRGPKCVCPTTTAPGASFEPVQTGVVRMLVTGAVAKGRPIYLSSGTAGAGTGSAPTNAAHYVFFLGVAQGTASAGYADVLLLMDGWRPDRVG